MKSLAIFVLILILLMKVSAQSLQTKPASTPGGTMVPEFKNEGEREDYETRELFKHQYKRKDFERYKGPVIVSGDDYQYGDQVLTVYVQPELKMIFEKGIFYPKVFDDHYADDLSIKIKLLPEKEKAKTEPQTDSARKVRQQIFFNLSRTDSLTISNLEELNFPGISPRRKRFSFWLIRRGLANPEVYFIELTNDNATTGTTMPAFIEGATLTFFKEGWMII